MSSPNVDPTYVPVAMNDGDSLDPFKVRFTGITNHGHIPIDTPYITHITDNLYVGGTDPYLMLPEFIKHEVSMYRWEEYDMVHPLKSRLIIEMLDTTQVALDKGQIFEISDWLANRLKEGPSLCRCFLPGTQVGGLTPTDISKATTVLSHDGSMNEVSFHHSNYYSGDVYTFSTTGALDFTCTPEHPFLVVKPYYFPSGFKAKPGMASMENVSTALAHYEDEPSWVEAKDIATGDFFVVPKATFPSTPKKQDWIITSGSPCCKPLESFYPDPDVAYMFGFYAADGGTNGNNGIGIAAALNDDVERLVRAWGKLGLEAKVSRGDEDNFYRIHVHSVNVSSSMRQWFGKGAEKRLPEFLFTGGWDLEEVLKGYADGDGYTNHARGATTCFSISRTLIEQVRMILVSLGYSPTVSNARRHSGKDNALPGYHVQWNPKATQHQTAWWRGMYLIPVTGVEVSNYEGEVYNLAVDNTESYTVNGVATHNCQAGLNRSNLIAGTTLVRYYDYEPQEAIDLLREKRGPAVLCNPLFEQFIRAL